MDDFLKMDVFFVVATIGLAAVSALACVLLCYAIRVVRTADRLVTMVEEEARLWKGDLDDARRAAALEAGRFLALISTVRKAAARFLAPRPPRG